MKSVLIFGETGRMGQEVKKIVEASPSLEYAGGFNRKNADAIKSLNPDIIIDFSLPAATESLINFVNEKPCAVVSGTTGWTEDEANKYKALGEVAPVFWSANMSFGVFLMCKLTEMLAKYDKFYNFKIEETHHIHKKDKPSGTAIMVKNAAEKSTSEIKTVESLREGEVFGIHRFIANSPNETLEIRHDATNRALFAQGAVDISEWLVSKPNGFYEMKDFFEAFNS